VLVDSVFDGKTYRLPEVDFQMLWSINKRYLMVYE